jgi:hypothetical protein
VLFCVLAGLDLNCDNIFYSIVSWLTVYISGIVLLRAVIVMFVVVGIILVVGTCCTSVISVAPICTNHGVGLCWAP